jgi:hypothetical protein
MSGCDFVVSGEHFDVDRYLESSPIAAGAEVFRRGDSTGLRSHPKNRISGFRTEIFEFKGLGIEKAISRITAFLHQHRDSIAQVKNWHGVEQCEISILMAWYEDTAALPLQLPAPFLQLLGSTGVSLSIDICAISRGSV